MPGDRALISLRLKAARWLAGTVQEAPAKRAGDEPKRTVNTLRVEELAKRRPLQDNGITKNRLEEIEQLKVDARPMELDAIAAALGLPNTWFADPAEDDAIGDGELETLLRQVQELTEAHALEVDTPRPTRRGSAKSSRGRSG